MPLGKLEAVKEKSLTTITRRMSSSASSTCEENDSVESEKIPPIKLNPFLIPHVIQQILSYCQFVDLKSTRLVSRLWEECGKIYFHPRRTLRLKNFQHINTFLSLEQDGFLISTQLATNVCLNGPEFQSWINLLNPFFTRFGPTIKSISIAHGLGDVTEHLLRLIVTTIESLEEISISGTTVLYNLFDRFGGGYETETFQFIGVLPTVKRINLKLPVTCFKRWTDVRSFFSHFFAIFPNVESIKFVGCQFPELFEYLPESIGFLRLRQLHIQLLNSTGLDRLMRRGLNIDRMVLDVEPILGLNHLHTFLESYSHCLTRLELRFQFKGAYNYSHNATAFPSCGKLRKLQVLKLYAYWGDLYFLKEFSELKFVEVEKMNWAIAFPRGTDEVGEGVRKILKFFDENGDYHALNY